MNILIVGVVVSIIGFFGVSYSSLFFGLFTAGIYIIFYSFFAEWRRKQSKQILEIDMSVNRSDPSFPSFCTNCGIQLKRNSPICPSCGINIGMKSACSDTD